MNKRYIEKICIFILLTSIFFSIFLNNYYYANAPENLRVLILFSYDEDYRSSIDFTGKIQMLLKKKYKNIEFDREYMDCKRIKPTKDYFNLLNSLYEYKYKNKNKKYNLVISVDDNAFEFLTQYSNNIFQDTPVLFCNMYTYRSDAIKLMPQFTGIQERINVLDTVSAALTFHPKAKQLNIFVRKTSFDIYMNEQIEKMKKAYGSKLEIKVFKDLTLGQAKIEMSKLPKDSINLLSGTFGNDLGDFIPIQESVAQLTAGFNIPMYTNLQGLIKHGVVGGMMVDEQAEAIIASKMIDKIFNGTKPSDIPVVLDTTNKYIFDYKQLQRFGIASSELPSPNKLVNVPLKSNAASKEIVFSGIILGVISVFLILRSLFLNHVKRMQAEADLRKSEELLRTLINATPDIICFKDGEGRWLEANKSMLTLFGLNNVAFKSENDFTLAKYAPECKDILDNCAQNDEEVWLQAKVTREERELRQPDGNPRTYDLIKVPTFKADGSRNGLVILGRDMTEKNNVIELKERAEETKRTLDQMKENDKVKTEFFANISHELRTPLNVILGALQLLELKQKNGELIFKRDNIAKYPQVMKQNCYRLVRIVNNLIDITKIDSGYFQLELGNYNIVSVVENITLSVKEYVESKGIELVFDTDVEEKLMAFDPDKIERIMLNLLSNAIKFTCEGGSILVSLEDLGEEMIIYIKDTGIGIPEEKQKVIFDRFIQVDKSLSRNREGSGIGLSLVKSLVEMHQGEISVISQPNKGSEFMIKLPVCLTEDKQIGKDFEQMKQSNIEKINIEFSDIYS